MEQIKTFFAEFKSIFVTDDILKENEAHANIVVASTMFNTFIISLLVYFLVFFKVFKLELAVMTTVLIRSVFLLAIPALISFILKGNKKWLKYVLFVCYITMLAIADAFLKNNATLIMVVPIVLAARYYNKQFTISIAVITTIAFAISTYMSANIGQQDINSYNLIIPEGTTITVTSTLRDAVNQVKVDETQRIKNLYIHFFLPKLFLFNIIAFACIQISQSGKKMIERQQEISKKGARIETYSSIYFPTLSRT